MVPSDTVNYTIGDLEPGLNVTITVVALTTFDGVIRRSTPLTIQCGTIPGPPPCMFFWQLRNYAPIRRNMVTKNDIKQKAKELMSSKTAQKEIRFS